MGWAGGEFSSAPTCAKVTESLLRASSKRQTRPTGIAFFFHSGKVHCLDLTRGDFGSTYGRMLKSGVPWPTLPILPNLQKISFWGAGGAEFHEFIRVFPGPCLTDVSFSWHDKSCTDDLLRSLLKHSPSLRRLSISLIFGEFYHDIIKDPAETTVGGLSHLQEFLFDSSLPGHIIKQLATLPHLHVLEFRVSNSMSVWQPAPGTVYFPSLRVLKVGVESISPVLVGIIEPLTRLECLTVRIQAQPTAEPLRSLLQSITGNVRLSNLEVRLTIKPANFSPAHLANPDTLEPLACLPLRVLDMSTVPFSLRDSSFVTLNEHFPDIRKLCLGHSVERTTSIVTLAGLEKIAEHFPKLEVLGIQCKWKRFRRADLGCARVEHLALQRFEPGVHMPQDPPLVAGILSALFPNATVSQEAVCSDPSTTVPEVWQDVKMMKEVMDLVRRQERLRLQPIATSVRVRSVCLCLPMHSMALTKCLADSR